VIMSERRPASHLPLVRDAAGQAVKRLILLSRRWRSPWFLVPNYGFDRWWSRAREQKIILTLGNPRTVTRPGSRSVP
jgi:hypothetical protein